MDNLAEQANEARNALTSSAWKTIEKYFKRHLDKRFNSIKKSVDNYSDWQSADKFYREVLGELKTLAEKVRRV